MLGGIYLSVNYYCAILFLIPINLSTVIIFMLLLFIYNYEFCLVCIALFSEAYFAKCSQ